MVILIMELITWSRVREKPVVAQLLKIFSALVEPITLSECLYPELDQSTHTLPPYFFRNNCNTTFLSMSRSSKRALPVRLFDKIFCAFVVDVSCLSNYFMFLSADEVMYHQMRNAKISIPYMVKRDGCVRKCL
jgi:hypothetical protein